MTFKAFVFDAYGTLFDVHAAVRRHAAAVGADAAALSDLWRAKQLEYTWVRSLTGAHRDFWAITEAALDYALARFPVADPAVREKLLSSYRALDAYPEVPKVLAALRRPGVRLAVLSNGTRGMLADAVAAAGIDNLLDAVLSVDEVRVFKTDARVYRLVGQHLDVLPPEVSFQSANRWDVAGATAFGFHSVWVNRGGLPDEYPDLPPARVIATLADLVAARPHTNQPAKTKP
jgi:2-haloacid dehalogenase